MGRWWGCLAGVLSLTACGDAPEASPAGSPEAPATSIAEQPPAVAAAPSAEQPPAALSADAPPPVEVPSPPASASNRYSVRGPAEPDPHIARQDALRVAAKSGMIGLLSRGTTGESTALTHVWGNDAVLDGPRDSLWGDEIGTEFGAGGLGLRGGGVGGDGRAGGLGSLGTRGGGDASATSGLGGLGTATRKKAVTVRLGTASVSGGLPSEVVHRVVRQNMAMIRACYDKGLARAPAMAGSLKVRFTIDDKGSVTGLSRSGDLPDETVADCARDTFRRLKFPEPDATSVSVVMTLTFSPTAPAEQAEKRVEPAPPAPKGPTVAGKPLKDAGVLDLERALRDAGCNEVSSTTKRDAKGAVVFTVEKGDRTFTITFVPAKVGGDVLGKDELARLRKVAEVHEASGFFLAIESDDESASAALLSLLVKA